MAEVEKLRSGYWASDSNFKAITDATAEKFENRFDAFNSNQVSLVDGTYEVDRDLDGNTDFSFGQPDFSFVQFRSNLVVRWEYIPGSEIFLVWSQDVSRSGDPTNGLLQDLNENVLGQTPQNIFLIKATYRLVL